MIFFYFRRDKAYENVKSTCMLSWFLSCSSHVNNQSWICESWFFHETRRKSGFVDSGLVVDIDEEDNNVFKPWAFLAFMLKKSCSSFNRFDNWFLNYLFPSILCAVLGTTHINKLFLACWHFQWCKYFLNRRNGSKVGWGIWGYYLPPPPLVGIGLCIED